MFLYRRGHGARRRVMHLAEYNRSGEIIGALCGSKRLNTSINLPLGLPICKECQKQAQGQRGEGHG